MRSTPTRVPAADRLGPEPEFDPEGVLDPVPFDMVTGPAGADGLFTAVPALMSLVVVVVVVIVVVKLVQAGQTFATNSSQPEETVSARVVARRSATEGGGGDTAVRTLYFATFEVAGGERLEMKVSPREYGLLVDGDEGQLTHQGTWYRRFERRRVIPIDGTWEAPGGPALTPPPQA